MQACVCEAGGIRATQRSPFSKCFSLNQNGRHMTLYTFVGQSFKKKLHDLIVLLVLSIVNKSFGVDPNRLVCRQSSKQILLTIWF